MMQTSSTGLRTLLVFSEVCAAVAAFGGPAAQASSHREAPFITTTPKIDATDFHMLNSYEPGRSGFVMLIVDYLPDQSTHGGPNYFKLDPNGLYETHLLACAALPATTGARATPVTFETDDFDVVLDDGGVRSVQGFDFTLRSGSSDAFFVSGLFASDDYVNNGSKNLFAANHAGLDIATSRCRPIQ